MNDFDDFVKAMKADDVIEEQVGLMHKRAKELFEEDKSLDSAERFALAVSLSNEITMFMLRKYHEWANA